MSKDESRALVLPANISVPDAYYKGYYKGKKESITEFLEDLYKYPWHHEEWEKILEKWEGRLNI